MSSNFNPQFAKLGEILIQNGKATETIRFNNVYNRMICYNTFSWHGAMSTNARDDDRLTLLFFIKGIHAGMYPLSRVSSMPC